MSDLSHPASSDRRLSLIQSNAEAEVDDLMRPSSPPAAQGDEDEEDPNINTPDVQPSDSEPPVADSNAQASSASRSFTFGPDLRVELVKAKRLSERHKLRPDQTERVEAFVKTSPLSREVELYVQLNALENKLDAIISAAPPFSVSPPLLDNIKSYTIAVLLSSKLTAYKGTTPRDHVFAIVLQERVYVPENISRDTHAKKVVNSVIQEELTQARSRIKKAIKSSISVIPTESESIYELATSVIANTRSAITVPLCARLALLRKMYTLDSDSKYWDKVDDRLALIRSKAGADVKMITCAFRRILETDRTTYGDATTYTIADGNADTWQTNIDNAISTAS